MNFLGRLIEMSSRLGGSNDAAFPGDAAKALSGPLTATIAPGAVSGGVSDVTVTLLDGNGNPIQADVEVSTTTDPTALSTLGAPTTLAMHAGGATVAGLQLVSEVANKLLKVRSTAAGVILVDVTAATTTLYFVLTLPSGSHIVSAAIVFP